VVERSDHDALRDSADARRTGERRDASFVERPQPQMAETNCESGDGGDKRSEAKRTHEAMVARSPDTATDGFGVGNELPAISTSSR
jgi:hypothetical protein